MVGWQIATEGFEDAKRNGSRDMMTVMAANATGNAIRVGEWDSAAAIMAELAATRAGAARSISRRLHHGRRWMLCAAVPSRRRSSEPRRSREPPTSPRWSGRSSRLRAWLALVGGRVRRGLRRSVGQCRRSTLPIGPRTCRWRRGRPSGPERPTTPRGGRSARLDRDPRARHQRQPDDDRGGARGAAGGDPRRRRAGVPRRDPAVARHRALLRPGAVRARLRQVRGRRESRRQGRRRGGARASSGASVRRPSCSASNDAVGLPVA